MHWPAILLVVALSGAQAQLTAQTSIAPELRECYTSVTLLNRNNLAPTSISVLIDIIRHIEDNPNVNMDLRQLSVALLHAYRQDGIEYHQPDVSLPSTANVLPFAPTFHSFHRHRLLLTRLIPNNLQVLPNDTISSSLKCAIHNMLSTTVDARLRGDESSCNQLSQYRALRIPRNAHSSIDDDVEILDQSMLDSANKNGQMKQYNPNDDVEYAEFTGSKSEKQVLGDSTCPLLRGVVHTTWGAVSAGNVIAGIAAGAQSQRVAVNDLSRTTDVNYSNLAVTSIYPATLSGDLAEAALIQGTERGSTTISVGAGGGWNSTQARKHYMLQSRVNIEMTDPEIRGDIDGFVLGSTIDQTFSTFGQIKLSQLLDMYYTARNGVFNPALRACNRRELSQQYIVDQTLATETFAFAAALDSNMPLRGTITGGLEELVTNAVTNFQTYTNQNLNDVNCQNTIASISDFRLKTSLYLVVDAAWQFETVYPAVSYILDHIEVGKYGSSVTLLSSYDGSVIINKTFSPAEFHSHYTLSTHQSLMPGVNLQTTLSNVRSLMLNELEHEKTINYVGGNSSALLFLINTGNLQNNEQVLEEARRLNETVPDLKIVFATASNQFDNLWNLVRDMHNDIHTISLTSNDLNVVTAMTSVVSSLSRVGRRIVNPNCGSEWHSDNLSGTRSFDDFVEPGYINFYSISPNYFYQNHDNRKVRITRSGAGVGNLIICHSRIVTQPRQNSTSNVNQDENSVVCQSLGTSGNVEISLRGACDGQPFINACPFFYISVQSAADGTALTSAMCSDTNACRFPYSNRYQVQIEDFGCFSNGVNIGASFILSTLAIIVIRWM